MQPFRKRDRKADGGLIDEGGPCELLEVERHTVPEAQHLVPLNGIERRRRVEARERIEQGDLLDPGQPLDVIGILRDQRS